MTSINIGIAGITGKFARSVVRSLLKNPEVKIQGYCRDPSKLSALLSSPRVNITQGQSDDRTALASFVKGSDVVVCCYLGDHSLMIDGQKLLIDACEAEGVRRYVASDYSLDFTKLHLGDLPPKDPMKHVKAYLETKESVQGVHVLIGIFMQTFFTSFFGMWKPGDTTFNYWGTGEEMWESTTYENAAEFVAAVAQDPNAIGVQRFLGDRKNIKQIAEAFERHYGKKPTLRQLGSLEDLYAHMQKVRNQEPSNAMAWIPLYYQYYCTNGQSYITPEISGQKLYPGVHPFTFNDFFEAHSAEELSTAAWKVGSDVAKKSKSY